MNFERLKRDANFLLFKVKVNDFKIKLTTLDDTSVKRHKIRNKFIYGFIRILR